MQDPYSPTGPYGLATAFQRFRRSRENGRPDAVLGRVFRRVRRIRENSRPHTGKWERVTHILYKVRCESGIEINRAVIRPEPSVRVISYTPRADMKYRVVITYPQKRASTV